MMHRHRHSAFALMAGIAAAMAGAVFTLLPGCKVSPDYSRPPLEVPGSYRSATTQQAAPVNLSLQWWTLFGDADLNDLEARAIYANQDLRAAMARVAQARATVAVTRSQFFPLVTADPTVTRSRSAAGRNGSSATATEIRIPFDVSYEVDIWGRVARGVESSRATFRQSQNDFAVILQTMQTDIAQDYFNLRLLDSQSDILLREIEQFRLQENLEKIRIAANIDNTLALSQVEALLQASVAQEADVRRQRAELEHAIAQLLGLAPSAFTIPPRVISLTVPTIPAGLPSDLLARRPDVNEAEQALVAANANVGVAVANFYPTLTLTGAAGQQSFDLQSIANWESRFLSFGPNLSIPLFEGGKLTGNLRQAKARYDELLATYRQSLLTAYREVEDSLSDLRLRAEAGAAQEKAVDAAREYLRLSNVQHAQGLIDSLQIIDADRTLLSNELTLEQIQAARLTSTVLLIKSLGGGWDPRRPTAVLGGEVGAGATTAPAPRLQ